MDELAASARHALLAPVHSALDFARETHSNALKVRGHVEFEFALLVSGEDFTLSKVFVMGILSM